MCNTVAYCCKKQTTSIINFIINIVNYIHEYSIKLRRTEIVITLLNKVMIQSLNYYSGIKMISLQLLTGIICVFQH